MTDSAAGATALSSGYKTNNGFLGLDPSKRARTTILELAHAAGLRTGLVTTTTITNATPAGFASHVAERNDEDAVAVQYLGEGVDVLMGGGRSTSRRRASPCSPREATPASRAPRRCALSR